MPKFLTHVNRVLVASALVFSLSGFTTLESLFAPKADQWDRWTAHDPQSDLVVNHNQWEQFLKTYVVTDSTGLNRVKYDRVTDADTKALHAYIVNLRMVPVDKLNKEEQMAYWINVYNALTIRLILEFYPVKTIQDIDLGSGFFSSGPWDEKLFKIDGELISLNDVEHRILRPIWKDPRIHYAVNCASVGCPNLQNLAFTSANLEALLDQGARSYINSNRNISFRDGKLVASKIYSWFQEDFGGSEQAVLAHMRTYANVGVKTILERVTGIYDYAYDWELNIAER